MPNVKLKDKNGIEQTYNGVNKIVVKDTSDNNVEVTAGIGYNVTLNVDNNVWQVIQVTQGSSIVLPTMPTKVGYSFGGWSTTSGATTPDVTFPYTPTGNVNLYAVWTTWRCTVSGLGSSATSSVTFTHTGTMPTFQQKTDTHGNIFLEIPTMYRKVEAQSSSQITSFTISMTNIDGTYEPYPCFVKEDGVTVMPYIWVGKYRSSASSGSINSTTATPVLQAIGTARTAARNLGTGYQLYDWQIQKLWQDLLICKMNTIDTNSGAGINEDALGFEWNKSSVWIDGVTYNSGAWACSYKPSAYVNSATSSTTDYVSIGYSCPSATSGANITKLGYDSSKPFFNYPSAASGTSYTTYYCDALYTSSGNHPVVSLVGNANAHYGAFLCHVNYEWSSSIGVRLCYRPL